MSRSGKNQYGASLQVHCLPLLPEPQQLPEFCWTGTKPGPTRGYHWLWGLGMKMQTGSNEILNSGTEPWSTPGKDCFLWALPTGRCSSWMLGVSTSLLILLYLLHWLWSFITDTPFLEHHVWLQKGCISVFYLQELTFIDFRADAGQKCSDQWGPMFLRPVREHTAQSWGPCAFKKIQMSLESCPCLAPLPNPVPFSGPMISPQPTPQCAAPWRPVSASAFMKPKPRHFFNVLQVPWLVPQLF